MIRHEEMDWGWDRPNQDPHLLPCLKVFHFRHSAFQQVQLVAGQQDPRGDRVVPLPPGMRSNSPILVGFANACS